MKKQVKARKISNNEPQIEIESDEEIEISDEDRSDFHPTAENISKNLCTNAIKKANSEMKQKAYIDFEKEVEAVFQNVVAFFSSNSADTLTTLNIPKYADSISKTIENNPILIKNLLLKLKEVIPQIMSDLKFKMISKKAEKRTLTDRMDRILVSKDQVNEMNKYIIQMRPEFEVLSRDIYMSFLVTSKSAKALEKIFQGALQIVKFITTIDLKVENMFLEEFHEMILQDDYISIIIPLVRKNLIEFSQEVNEMFNKIEAEITKRKLDDMKRLRDLNFDGLNVEVDDSEGESDERETKFRELEKIVSWSNTLNLGKKMHQKKEVGFTITKENSEKVERERKVSLQSEVKVTVRSDKSNMIGGELKSTRLKKEKKTQNKSDKKEQIDKNLDELYEYIIAEDESKTKKKKKTSHTKTSRTKTITKQIENMIEQVEEHKASNDEGEVLQFKKELEMDSIHARKINKIKPSISKEWISHLSNLQ